MLRAKHPHTLEIMRNMASTYQKQGRWKEAEKLLLQIMETRLRVLGAERHYAEDHGGLRDDILDSRTVEEGAGSATPINGD